ncbi:MAG: hypothetical protein PWR17_1072 [Candidatus Methanomethylophilaceae archaeon]|nr:hypothetical protein [Candidatus Methanomethylophilaceae archaeon]
MPNTMENMPQMPKNDMLGMLLSMGVMIIVMMYRAQVGYYLNYAFQYIDFGGKYPVMTLMIAGLLMTTLSTIIRSLMTDPLKMAKTQHVQKEFNLEMRKARMENNLFKLKKLTEQQPQMMAASMSSSQDQMKIMPMTMIIVIPIYAWVWFFIGTGAIDPVINVPWASVNLLHSYVLPAWILIYTLISIPIGQLVNKIIRFFLLKRRIGELEDEGLAV